MQQLAEKRVIVTGASSGIGRETARTFAKQGATVAVAARSTDRLRELKRELESEYDTRILVVPTDVSDEAEVKTMVETVLEELGGLDVLVNNAGVDAGKSVEETTTAEFRKAMAVNVEGSFFTTREAIPHIRKANGHLVFVGSITGKYPHAYPVYSATKWWVRGFALSLEASLGPQGVAVTVVNPSGVRTEFGADTPAKARYDEGEAIEPEDVAETIAFASRQERGTISELDLFSRGRLGE